MLSDAKMVWGIFRLKVKLIDVSLWSQIPSCRVRSRDVLQGPGKLTSTKINPQRETFLLRDKLPNWFRSQSRFRPYQEPHHPRHSSSKDRYNGGVSNAGGFRSGLVLIPRFCQSCFGSFPIFCQDFPNLFGELLRGFFSEFCPAIPLLGLLTAPTRNSPERVRDTIRTFPEKSGKPPGFSSIRLKPFRSISYLVRFLESNCPF